MLVQKIDSAEKVDSDNVAASIELIDSCLAKTYLSRQRTNRNLSDSRIKDYANRIARGEWKVSQPLLFDDENYLIDGQHRLSAVIQANIPTLFVVLRGLPPDSRFTFDQGQKRSTAQIATIMGIDHTQLSQRYSTLRCAFYGQLLGAKNKTAEKNAQKLASPIGSVSSDFLIQLSLKHKDALDFALARPGLRKDAAIPQLGVVRAPVFRAYYNENRERLKDFLRVYYTGFTDGVEHPSAAIALRNYILAQKTRGSGLLQTFAVSLDLYKKTESAIKHFALKNNVRSVIGSERELFPLADFD